MFWRHEPTYPVLAVTLIVAMTSLADASLADASRTVLLSRPINDVLLEQHNIFRQEEKASNIFKMHWNRSVADAASDWASQCQFKHKLSGPYGENLFYSSDPSFEDFDIREILLDGMELWHDEKRGWTYSSDSCGAACHYTQYCEWGGMRASHEDCVQMVWSTTTSVGCAHQMCHGLTVGRRSVDRALYLVCFYYPSAQVKAWVQLGKETMYPTDMCRGNWVGEYPFKTGRPCSDCGSGTCQDGLCVEQKASFSSYHTQSENEVKSGSTFNWNYSARGPDSLHQASTFKNVSSVTSREPNQNGFRHTSSRHTQHDIRVKTPSGHHHSRHTSSSVFQVSRNSQRAVQLRQRELTYSSGGSLGREFESYNSSRSRLPSLAPAALRQDPRQAQYARGASERVNNSNRREILADSVGHRSRSPLDVLRADTHWCRDRLPSCRIWTRDCQKSKAVYLACPRTCGHCGKHKDKEKPNALRDRPPPSPPSPPQPTTPHHRRAHHRQLRVQQQRRQQQQRQQRQRSHPQRTAPQQQQLQRQKTTSPTVQLQQRLQRPEKQKQQRLRNIHRSLMDRRRGKKNGGDKRQKKRPAGQRKGPRKAQRRQGQKKGRRQGQRRGNGKRRRPLGPRKVKVNRRQQRHKRFRNVDKRAEKLAQNLRKKAVNGGRCADDTKYSRSCPSWVQKGFCNDNALVSYVYCKLSCNSC